MKTVTIECPHQLVFSSGFCPFLIRLHSLSLCPVSFIFVPKTQTTNAWKGRRKRRKKEEEKKERKKRRRGEDKTIQRLSHEGKKSIFCVFLNWLGVRTMSCGMLFYSLTLSLSLSFFLSWSLSLFFSFPIYWFHSLIPCLFSIVSSFPYSCLNSY